MTRPLVPALLVLALVFAATAAPAQEARSSTGIVGSYVLASRTLADGTEVLPPAVQGFLTYTADGMRNFNVVWDNPDGTRTSISYLAAYTLEDDRYCEQPMLWIQQNLMDTPGLSTDAPEVKTTDCGTVTVTAEAVSFPVPGVPVTLTFDAAGVTAVAEPGFTDHWERVD